METSFPDNYKLPGKFTDVRFHLGSGINGNNQGQTHCKAGVKVLQHVVRFHLGSGINGNGRRAKLN